MISIIIRTKNEEKWISSCLRSIFDQTYKKFEIIIVDNYSKDKTIHYAKKFNVKIIKIKKYLPGKAINLGVKNSKGQIIVILSAHCIPTNNKWLHNLTKNLKRKDVAGVYGRQQPLSFSSDYDKRDLLNYFGLDKKIQKKDSFFHNANSAIKRKIWKKIKFNEKITNIEDRVWGEEIIKNNLKLIYEPSASVYHYHGIHQDMNAERAKNIVQILENIKTDRKKLITNKNLNKLNILCIIPIAGESIIIDKSYLLEKCIKNTKLSKYIKHIFVATDNKNTSEIARKNKVDSSFLRPKNLSEHFIDESEILDFVISKFEKKKKFFDIIVCIKETYPFRDYKLIDKMLETYVKKKSDTIIAIKKEQRNIWIKEKENKTYKFKGLKPRDLKQNEVLISLAGLCYITNPIAIRNLSIFNGKLDYYEVKDFFQPLEIGKNNGLLNNKEFKKINSIFTKKNAKIN